MVPVTTPGGNPATTALGSTPMFPVTLEGPVLLTAPAASTPKPAAVPRFGCADGLVAAAGGARRVEEDRTRRTKIARGEMLAYRHRLPSDASSFNSCWARLISNTRILNINVSLSAIYPQFVWVYGILSSRRRGDRKVQHDELAPQVEGDDAVVAGAELAVDAGAELAVDRVHPELVCVGTRPVSSHTESQRLSGMGQIGSRSRRED